MANLKKAILLFSLQVFLYGVIALNLRSIAQVSYFWTAITDAIISAGSLFALFEIFSGTKRSAKVVGYVSGSVVGGILGLYLSTFIL